MQQVSLIWESEMSILAWLTPKVSAYWGMSLKEVIKGLAKPLVICRLTPRSIEKQKKMAIFFCLSRAKARSPSASATDFFSPLLTTGQWGSVKV